MLAECELGCFGGKVFVIITFLMRVIALTIMVGESLNKRIRILFMKWLLSVEYLHLQHADVLVSL